MSRRDYLKTTAIGTAGLFAAPTIVPSTVFGKNAPSNIINIAQIGFGRIARGHDLPETMKHDEVRVIAVSDVDHKRMEEGKAWVERFYAERPQPQRGGCSHVSGLSRNDNAVRYRRGNHQYAGSPAFFANARVRSGR